MDTSDTSKYHPFKLFSTKKQSESDEQLDEESLHLLWKELKNKKKLKFIKKAEKAFDEDHEAIEVNKDNCFANYLSRDDLKLLLESYNFPQNAPSSLRELYYQKNGVTNQEPGIFGASYMKLTNKERFDLSDAYTNSKEEYYRNYVAFLDQLPQNRFIDYRLFVNPLFGKEAKVQQPKQSRNKKKKNGQFMLPYEFYFKKHENKYVEQEKYAYIGKMKARTEFKSIDDSKKIKYIKECEKHFDEQQHDGKIFASLLNKYELQLLLESYGMPKSVPPTPNGYYFKLHYNDDLDIPSTEKFRILSENYRNMQDHEKAEFIKQHLLDRQNYTKNLEEFKASLPPNRLDDYNEFVRRLHPVKKSESGKHSSAETASNLDSDADHHDLNHYEDTNGSHTPKKAKR